MVDAALGISLRYTSCKYSVIQCSIHASELTALSFSLSRNSDGENFMLPTVNCITFIPIAVTLRPQSSHSHITHLRVCIWEPCSSASHRYPTQSTPITAILPVSPSVSLHLWTTPLSTRHRQFLTTAILCHLPSPNPPRRTMASSLTLLQKVLSLFTTHLSNLFLLNSSQLRLIRPILRW